MKKVAILTYDATAVMGGFERVMSVLSKQFSDSGKYSIVIVSILSLNGTMRYPLPDDVKIIHLNMKLDHRNIFSLMLYSLNIIFTLSNLCKKEKVDIFMGTHFIINFFLPFIKNCKIKIGTEHASSITIPKGWKIVQKMFYPMLDCLVCLTDSDAKNYSYLKNIRVIPNQSPFVVQKKSELGNKVVLAIGRLVKLKGFDILIDIVSEIKDNCTDWQFRVVGDGEEELTLKEQVKKLKLNDLVKILPATPEIIKEYLNASIFVMLSSTECFPLTIVEAMICGLPVISFNCPYGPAAIITNNVDGFLVENGNKKAFSEALLKLMYDENLRKNIGKQAAKNIQRFSPDRVFKMWDNLFEELEKGKKV
jgi:glycosyltransferase involved in cell wall biosynthesis